MELALRAEVRSLGFDLAVAGVEIVPFSLRARPLSLNATASKSPWRRPIAYVRIKRELLDCSNSEKQISSRTKPTPQRVIDSVGITMGMTECTAAENVPDDRGDFKAMIFLLNSAGAQKAHP